MDKYPSYLSSDPLKVLDEIAKGLEFALGKQAGPLRDDMSFEVKDVPASMNPLKVLWVRDDLTRAMIRKFFSLSKSEKGDQILKELESIVRAP